MAINTVPGSCAVPPLFLNDTVEAVGVVHARRLGKRTPTRIAALQHTPAKPRAFGMGRSAESNKRTACQKADRDIPETAGARPPSFLAPQFKMNREFIPTPLIPETPHDKILHVFIRNFNV